MFMYSDYSQHLLDHVKKIHFIGCGGSGMYPLIQILAAKGYELSGSDVLDGSIEGRIQESQVDQQHIAGQTQDLPRDLLRVFLSFRTPYLRPPRRRGSVDRKSHVTGITREALVSVLYQIRSAGGGTLHDRQIQEIADLLCAETVEELIAQIFRIFIRDRGTDNRREELRQNGVHFPRVCALANLHLSK